MKKIIAQIACLICRALSDKVVPTADVPSPRDIIPAEDVTYDSLTGMLQIKNLKPSIWLASVSNTKSMDPTIDVGHTAILTNNFPYEDLAVGDVAVYEPYPKKLVMHRIFKIETDNKGRKYTFKSDRVSYPDPYVLRNEHIKYLLLGVIY